MKFITTNQGMKVKKHFMSILKFAGWTGFTAYTAIVIYGLCTLEFKVMLPWLNLLSGFIAVIFAYLTRIETNKVKEISGSLKYS